MPGGVSSTINWPGLRLSRAEHDSNRTRTHDSFVLRRDATEPMRSIALAALLLVAWCPAVNAQGCPEGKAYEDAREVVRDLQRIVAPNGVQDLYKARIGGIDQWISVRGQDKSNPVVLFLHGGPAAPLIPGIWEFQRPIEEYFTVVNYDQRGAGLTYLASRPEAIGDTVHIGRYVADAIEVAEHIRQRLGQHKLVLMGHSWGTIVGMQAARERPDLFSAYVGIGQVINARDNERLSFQYALDQARMRQNKQAVAELESIAPYPGDQPITRERIMIARKWAQFYGGLSAYRDGGARYYFAPGCCRRPTIVRPGAPSMKAMCLPSAGSCPSSCGSTSRACISSRLRS